MALKDNVDEVPHPVATDTPFESAVRVRFLLRRAYNRMGPDVFMQELCELLNEAGLLDEQPDVRLAPVVEVEECEHLPEYIGKIGVDDGTRTRDNRNHNPPLSLEDLEIYQRIVQRYGESVADSFVRAKSGS